MKRFVCLLVGAATMATVSMAQTNVLSQNAVGYVKVTVPSDGGLALVRMDFESLDGSPQTMANIVGDQLPVGAVAHIWDRGTDAYVSQTKTRAGWPLATEVSRGDGFWLQNAGTGPEADVYLMGEVPGDNNNSQETTVDDITGIALVGYPYPVSTAWTSTSLSADLPIGSFLHIWDSTSQSYNSYSKTRAGWGTASAEVIEPGQGFWVETSGAFDWTVTKPYAWP